MQNKKLIAAEIELVASFKLLAQAYEEISVMKMQRVRGSVVKTRDFLVGLTGVFHNVRASYAHAIQQLISENKKKKVISFTTLKKNGKTVSVFISPNGKLYGHIVSDVFDFFIERTSKQSSDIVIIGRMGRQLYESYQLKKPYIYFEMPDVGVEIADIKDLINLILNYERVYIYYGQFLNVVTQRPTIANVTAEQTFTDMQEKEEFQFIFEPGLEKLFTFFETQIFGSLVKQTVHESHLANFASRMKAMEEALSYIDTHVMKLKRDYFKAKKLEMNKKQNQSIAGITLWKIKH